MEDITMSNNESTSKNLLIPGAIILGFVILLAGMIWALNTFSFRVATIDLNKIVKDSSYGQQIDKELQKKGEQLKAQLMTAKTDAEKAKINNDFHQFQVDKQNAFVEKVKEITAEVSKAKGIKAVSSPQVFFYSATDITSDVITKLDK
jgi:Skp family chaperone for outer membrane proteins